MPDPSYVRPAEFNDATKWALRATDPDTSGTGVDLGLTDRRAIAVTVYDSRDASVDGVGLYNPNLQTPGSSPAWLNPLHNIACRGAGTYYDDDIVVAPPGSYAYHTFEPIDAVASGSTWLFPAGSLFGFGLISGTTGTVLAQEVFEWIAATPPPQQNASGLLMVV